MARDAELSLLYKQLKDLQEKHEKYKKDLQDAIDQGDGLHDNALWQSAQDRFNINLSKINKIKELIRKLEKGL